MSAAVTLRHQVSILAAVSFWSSFHRSASIDGVRSAVRQPDGQPIENRLVEPWPVEYSGGRA